MRQTTQLLETILDSTHALVACMDCDFNFITVNRAYAAADGRDPSFFPGKNHFDLYPYASNKEMFQRVVDTGEPLFIEARPFDYVEHPERGTSYWNWSLVPIKDEGGVTGVVLTLLDVTDRVRIEQELRDSQARLRAVVDNTTAMVFVKDRDGRYLLASRKLAELARLSEEEVTGKTDHELYPRELADDYVKHDNEVISSAQARQYEEDYVRLDGTIGTALSVKVPLFDANGVPYAVCGISTDITAKKQAEHLLQNYAQSIADVAPIMVMTFNTKGEMTKLNRFTTELLGYEEDELLGRNWQNGLPGETRKYLRSLMKQAVEQNILTQGFEVTLPCKDGRQIITSWYSSVQRDSSGEPVGVVAVGVDITKVRQAEEQLRQAAKMEAIGRLAGGVAHDFNNYLTAIKGYATLMAADVPPDSQTSQDLNEIVSAADHAADLTRQLLTFGRRAPIEPAVIDLNHVLSEIQRSLGRVLREDIELSFQPAPDLANTKADAGQIQQVVLNLVINARDAMPNGGSLTISTRNARITGSAPEFAAVKPGRYVEMDVTDTGIGMSAETMKHIFEPFFTLKETGKGTGLGLATVHGIVKQSGGHISVESELDAGTTFKVYLPAVDEAEETDESVSESTETYGGNETILVVEDDPALRHFMTRALSNAGYKVIGAGMPDEAAALAQRHADDIDLLVTDIVLPQMNGLQLAHKVQAHKPDLPVLFVSGYVKDAIPDHDIAQADIELLIKPFTAEELCARIRRRLNACSRRQSTEGSQ